MKKLHRFNQVVSQTLGRSEKSDVLGEELVSIDQRVTAMVKALEHIKKKLIDSMRSMKAASSKEEANSEKRRKGLEEHKLSQAIVNDARAIDATFEHGLLSDVMMITGDSLSGIVDEIVQYEIQVEQDVLEKLTKFHEDLKSISNQKEKLKKLVLDMDSARTRLNAAQVRGERTNEIQDELDNAQLKVDNCKDTLACELYTLASKEVDMAVLFKVLLQIQIEFHRTVLKRLEATQPLVVQKIDTYPRRPVYGCPLEDHLRYSGSKIAIVLEVCCAAMYELGLRDEGLFRISGNATKVRKLKASFDAGEIDLSDFERDPHSIASALKSYLRELPDSLMTNNLYRDWMSAVSIQNQEARLAAIKAVVDKLPECNYANLRYLVKFLSKLAENQQFTKMSPQNLAIVLAPNMIWSTVGEEGFGLNNVHGTLVETLISNANYFFPGEIRFTSPHIAAIIDKTGGFLENGPLTRAVALTINVAKACVENDDAGDGQLSPNKGASSRRPKQPAPPPPPPPSAQSSVHAKSKLSPNMQRSGPMRITPTLESCFKALPEESLSSNDEEDVFGFSPEIDPENKRKPLPPRPRPPPYSTQQPTEPTAMTRSTPASAGEFAMGHRKTNSLDRPLRPPPLSTEKKRNSTVRQFPKEDELDELLLSGFGESGKEMSRSEQGTNGNSTLPRPNQQQRPALPIKAVSASPNVVRRGEVETKLDGRTMVRISQSDTSEDDEPVVTALETEHIYYDVPSGKKLFSLPTWRGGKDENDGAVALISVSKKQESPAAPVALLKTGTSPETADEATSNGQSVAQRRESLMKLFGGGEQQAGSVPIRQQRPPPVPSKPRSAEFTEKDIVRF